MCGAESGLELHHVNPQVYGGPSTLEALCGTCHGGVHGVKRPSDLSSLIKEGQRKAALEGRHAGRPRKTLRPTELHAVLLAALRGGAKRSHLVRMGVSRAAVHDASAELHRNPGG